MSVKQKAHNLMHDSPLTQDAEKSENRKQLESLGFTIKHAENPEPLYYFEGDKLSEALDWLAYRIEQEAYAYIADPDPRFNCSPETLEWVLQTALDYAQQVKDGRLCVAAKQNVAYYLTGESFSML